MRLKDANFRHEDISILFSSPDAGRELAVENAGKAPEGATTGGGIGALLGGVLGWLAGIGTIAIPGVGPFIAAGPIMGMLAGLGVGGAVGSVTGALIGMGIPEYEASRYEGRIRDGGMLLSVHCDDNDWAKNAKEILTDCGGQDVGSKSEVSEDRNARTDDYAQRPGIR